MIAENLEISVIKNLESQFKQIIHLADIHIRNKSDRDDEYRSVFENLNLKIRSDNQLKKNEILIIICGDIFHDARKDRKLSPNAIQMFKNLISKLKKIGTLIIIPGNHDNNVTYQSDNDNTIIDALESVLSDFEDNKNDVFYLRKTGIYQFGNILLSTVSVFDLDKIYLPEYYEKRLDLLNSVSINQDNKYKDFTKVFVGHFGIDGANIENGYVLNNCCYKITDLEKYDMVCLGDTHKHQFLGDKKQIGYPNSLIQQGYGESITEHGYIKWNIEKREGKFIEIMNKYGHIEIDSNDNIENKDFPKNSYIKYYTNQDDNIETIREQIQKKTNIVSLKIKTKYIDEPNDTVNIQDELNDYQKKLDYIKKTFPDKTSDEHKILADKLTKDENEKKHKTETGRSTLIFKKLNMIDFQIYGNSQTIDFDKYPKNSTLSINGDNTTGKSTILRAIEFTIFGPEKGKHESYINNTKSSCKCIIEFEHDNKLYRITRTIKKKGIDKHNLKLEKNNNNKWDNLTDKHTRTTQEKIDDFFGTKENAEITWLKQQGSNSSFRDDKENFSKFNQSIGVDTYVQIAENTKKTKKEIENRLKQLNTKKDDIKVIKPQYNLDELNNEKKDIESKLNIHVKEVKNEVNKKQYGTKEEKTKWENEILNNMEDIKKYENNLIDISEDEYENKKLLHDTNIRKLSLEKDALLSKLPPKPQPFNSDKTLEDIEIELTKINENLSSKSCKKSLQEINTKIGGLESDLNHEEEKKQKYKNLVDSLEKQEKKLKEISVDSVNYEKELKSLNEINETITKNNSKIDNNIIYKPNDKLEKVKVKKNLERELRIKETNIKESKEKIKDLSHYDNIEKEYENLLTTENELEKEEYNRKIIENNLRNTNENLAKYKALKFNSNCECCDNNKSHYEIDIYEQELNDLNNALKKSNEDINEYNKMLYKLKPYKELYETRNENIKYEKNINDTNMEIEYIELQLLNIHRDLEDIDKIKEIYDRNDEITNENKELEKTKSNKTKMIAKIKKDIEKKNKQEAEITKLTLLRDSVNYSEIKHKTLTEELDEYRNIENLHQLKISFEEQKNNIITNENYNKIEKDINQIHNNICENEKELEKLKYDYNESYKYRNNILDKKANISNLEQKINDYNEKGGYNQDNIDKLENNIGILERKKEDIIEKIGEIKCIQKEYNDSIKKLEDLNAKITNKDKELINILDYLKIVNPATGYPNEIIKSKLEYFSNIINKFIKNAKFKFKVKIDTPEFVENSKKQTQKLIFNFIKDNKTFSNLSGAENFIADLAITSSLSKILDNISPPLLAIDEGFSCLDQDHIHEIPALLDRIKSEFNLILYISHNKSIKGKADNNIYIEKYNNESKLVFS